MSIKSTLFKIARGPVAGLFIGQAFAHFSALMPLDKLYSDENVLVFKHPSPWWQHHLLAVPKRRLPDLLALLRSPTVAARYLPPLLAHLAAAAPPDHAHDYTILVNGGHYQDVPQVHFHLAAGNDRQGQAWGKERWAAAAGSRRTEASAIAYAHPTPTRTVHWLVTSSAELPSIAQLNWQDAAVLDAFQLASTVSAELGLDAWTILMNAADRRFCLHLVSGDTI